MRNMIAMFLFIALVAALFYIVTGKPPAVASWGAVHGAYIPPENPRSE